MSALPSAVGGKVIATCTKVARASCILQPARVLERAPCPCVVPFPLSRLPDESPDPPFCILHSAFILLHSLRPAPTRTPRLANTIAPPDHPHGCKDVSSMFLGCSLLVSSFLLPLFVPSCPRSRHPRHAKTRALQPGLPLSARAPIRSSRPASRQPTVATANIETAAASSRLQ